MIYGPRDALSRHHSPQGRLSDDDRLFNRNAPETDFNSTLPFSALSFSAAPKATSHRLSCCDHCHSYTCYLCAYAGDEPARELGPNGWEQVSGRLYLVICYNNFLTILLISRTTSRWTVLGIGLGMIIVSLLLCGYVTHRMGVCLWAGPQDDSDSSSNFNRVIIPTNNFKKVLVLIAQSPLFPGCFLVGHLQHRAVSTAQLRQCHRVR